MTRDKATELGIITGGSYPQNLAAADIMLCNVKDQDTKESCVRKFKDELERRKEAIQQALKGLHVTEMVSDGFQLGIIELQAKIKNATDNLTTYETKLEVAETELKGAQAAYDKANKHSRYGGCGYSPLSNPHFNGCLNPYLDAITKKTALRDTSKTNKEKVEQDLNIYTKQLNTLKDNVEKHIEAVIEYAPDDVPEEIGNLEKNSMYEEL